MHLLTSVSGVPCDVRSGGSRRFVERPSTQCARELSQRQQPDEPQRQPGVSCVVFVPHFRPSLTAQGQYDLLRVLSPACPARDALPELAADHGLWPEAKSQKWRRRVPPAQRYAMASLSGTYQSEAPPERALRCLICCASSRPASGPIPPP